MVRIVSMVKFQASVLENGLRAMPLECIIYVILESYVRVIPDTERIHDRALLFRF